MNTNLFRELIWWVENMQIFALLYKKEHIPTKVLWMCLGNNYAGETHMSVLNQCYFSPNHSAVTNIRIIKGWTSTDAPMVPTPLIQVIKDVPIIEIRKM